MLKISVIIVNYNVRELLENCINSILQASHNITVEIIVFDNNSFDGSVEFIKKKFSIQKNITVIANNENIGFAKANNEAVKFAKGEFLLILNPDTILQEDTLEKVMHFYNNTQKCGAVTCKLILPNGELDVACRRSFPKPSVAITRVLGLSKIFPKSKIFGKYNLTYLDENKTYEVDAIVGAFMFMKRDLFSSLGGFDEEYFMYGEDLDLCYRIKQRDLSIWYYHETSIIHYKGSSTRKSSLSYVRNFYTAMRLFTEKNLKIKSPLLNILIKISIKYRAFLAMIKRFFKEYYVMFIDLVLILISMLISIKLRFEFFPVEAYTIVIIVYMIVWFFTLSISGTYKKINRFNIKNPFNGILFGFFINSALTYYFNEFAFSRAVVLRTTAYSCIALVAWRLIINMLIYIKQKNLLYREARTLIIGKNQESETFISNLKKRVDTDYNVIGFISSDVSTSDGFLGNLNNLEDIIGSFQINNIIFTKEALTNQQIFDLMWKLKNYNINFKILSPDNEIIMGKSPIDKVDDLYLMQIEYNITKKFNIFVKRIFDLLVSIFLLIFIYPWFFIYYKISKNIDNLKYSKKLLLIPEVLKGKLSMVGRTEINNQGSENYYGKLGLTGLAQINYYKNLSQDEIEYFNMYYAKNQTLALDLEILLKSLSVFIFEKRIYKT